MQAKKERSKEDTLPPLIVGGGDIYFFGKFFIMDLGEIISYKK